MKDNLKFFKLGELAEIFAGGDKPDNFNLTKTEEYQIPVFANGETNKGLQGFTNKARVKQPSVTVSARGTIGYTVLRNEPFVPIVRLLTLIPDREKLDIEYLYYYLTLFRQTGLGSSQAQLTVPDISNRKISIRNLLTQKAIGATLSLLDKKIELNNKINNELEKMAKTLYNYWFVQFDFPDDNGKPYKSSGGKMIWNNELKKEIPNGWCVKKVSDLLPVVTGKQDANFATENGEYNFFTCGEEILKCDTYEFEGKAILVAGNGNFNIKLYEGKFNAYQRTYILIPNDERYYTLVYLAVRDRIASLAKGSRGSIVKFITKGDLEDIKIPLPKDENLDVFSQLNIITKKIEKNILENQKLIELRDWLLPMLMNGQISIK